MKKITVILSVLLLTIQFAQAQFVEMGRIDFERKTNLKLQLQNEMGDNEWVKNMLPQLPQTHSTFFTLYFNTKKSIWQFDKAEEIKGMGEMFTNRGPARDNKVLTNFKEKQVIAEKEIFEAKYLIQDSMVFHQWKIEDEVRVIAGYACRKATTKLYDSVVVVAFFTDEIVVSGGPESFNGLPGMILGIAIPRLYTTWFATNVELLIPKEEQFVAPSKGKKATNKEVYDSVMKSTKQWGPMGATVAWWVAI